MSEKKMTFEDLKEEVRRLNILLEDPQPGLMTWCLLYGDRMQRIVQYWEEN